MSIEEALKEFGLYVSRVENRGLRKELWIISGGKREVRWHPQSDFPTIHSSRGGSLQCRPSDRHGEIARKAKVIADGFINKPEGPDLFNGGN